MKAVDNDGKELLVPLRDAQGQPVTKDGQPQFEKGDDGRFVLSGTCRLFAIKFVGSTGNQGGYPPGKSNWSCFDPAKFAMIDRLSKTKKERTR